MSFYRTFIGAVAAMGLATAVFAADETTTTTTQATDNNNQAMQTTTPSSNTMSSTETKVDVNKATVKELMKVKGLNRSKANAIVTYRKSHGEFKSLDDLKEVKGFKKMNEKTMKEIQDQLTV